MKHFKEVCRRSKSSTVHNVEKKADQKQETDTETININSVIFNSNHSAIIEHLKTSSNKVVIMVTYKVDTGSDGIIIPLYIYKKLFPRAVIEQLAAKRDTNIKL